MDIHFFDVDYTILRKSSSYYFLMEALKQHVLALNAVGSLPFDWLRYKFGTIHDDFIARAVAHMAGIEEQTVNSIAQTCFERRAYMNIYAEALLLINSIQQNGGKALLATSAFSHIIKPLEHFLNIEESLATVLEFSEGKTTGRIVGNALFGRHKKDAVAVWLETHHYAPQNVWLYSDSYTDLPLFDYVGHPVAVNPDRFLQKQAQRRGWQILRWHRRTDPVL
ncbi:MAG: HAD family phosphatase [Treponema sp.]|jgi:HAD superfamily hydrolase (TIGR01490 family)|nr:HAD family phosphatase [Treponema sp.]